MLRPSTPTSSRASSSYDTSKFKLDISSDNAASLSRGFVTRFVTKYIRMLPKSSVIKTTHVVKRLLKAALSCTLASGMDMMNMVLLSERKPQLSM